MQDIDIIYRNKFGVSFKWKKKMFVPEHKYQIVFRDTGMLLTLKEIHLFSEKIHSAKKVALSCGSCPHKNVSQCKNILVETPSSKISFAMNFNEIELLNELIEGTIYNIDLNNLLVDLKIS